MSMTDGIRIGPYEVLGTLGHGGMGIVYRARHGTTGDLVALKTVRIPHARQLQGIRREIHALARIRHPGIVRIVDEGVRDGIPWYAMELLEGTSLRKHAARLTGWQTDKAETHSVKLPTRPELGNRSTKIGSAPATVREPNSAADRNDPTAGHWRLGDAEELGSAPGPGETQSSPHAVTFRPDSSPGQDSTASVSVASDNHVPPETPEQWEPMVPPSRPAAGGALLPILELIQRLCDPLSYFHGEGIVHRDLKPENILIRHDGTPVLVDFGLMSQFAPAGGRERMIVDGLAIGTVAYMAPEQIRGELVDARADLYSLGCILYELVTGRQPFRAKSDSSILWLHLNGDPRRPSELVMDIPTALDDLILRLLAKQPEERLGYADDVAAALERLGACAKPHGTKLRPKAYLYRSRLAGRADDMEVIQGHLSSLQRGSGGLLLIRGAAGMGKTRLAMEAARMAEHRRIPVLTSQCVAVSSDGPHSRGEPLSALRPQLRAIADHCRQMGDEETRRILGPRARILARYEPTIARLPGLGAYDDPPKLFPEAAVIRLYSFLCQTFTELARNAPILLVLDDLQWADELTLGWLRFSLQPRYLASMRTLIIATLRHGPTNESTSPLLHHPEVHKLEPNPLDLHGIRRVIRDMLALPAPPEGLVQFLFQESEGNPFYVAEVLHAAISEGLLSRDEAGAWHMTQEFHHWDDTTDKKLPLPSSLLQLSYRRLEGLPPRELELIEVAALLGRIVDPELLAELTGLDDLDLMSLTRELLRRKLLEETSSSAALRFGHDTLREAAYSRIAVQERRRLHHQAARLLEERIARGREVSLRVVGYHWENAQKTNKARDCYLAGARKAVSKHAHADAESLYRAFLRLSPEHAPRNVVVLNELAEKVLRIQGRATDAMAQLRTALELAREQGDYEGEAASWRNLGRISASTGQLDDARAFYERALGLYRLLGLQTEEGVTLIGLAYIHGCQGRLPLAQENYAKAMELQIATGDRHFENVARLGLASIMQRRGQTATALALIEDVQQGDTGAGSLHSKAEILTVQARVKADSGHLEMALQLFQQAQELYGELGNRRNEAMLLSEIAEVRYLLGDVRGSNEPQERALRLLREVGERRLEADALLSLGRRLREQGFFEAALSLTQDAQKIHTQIDDCYGIAQSTTSLARLRADQSRHDDARSLAHQALESLENTLDPGLRCTNLLILAGAALADGRLDDAREHCEQAIRRLSSGEAPFVLGEHQALLARVERLSGTPGEKPQSYLEAALHTARSRRRTLLQIQCFCELGHHKLAHGQSAKEELHIAKRLIRPRRMRRESRLATLITDLAKAETAFEDGQVNRLFRGAILDDLPDNLRARLTR